MQIDRNDVYALIAASSATSGKLHFPYYTYDACMNIYALHLCASKSIAINGGHINDTGRVSFASRELK